MKVRAAVLREMRRQIVVFQAARPQDGRLLLLSAGEIRNACYGSRVQHCAGARFGH